MRIGSIVLDGSLAHWERNGTKHGPQSNPFLVAVRLVHLGSTVKVTGRRLWVYFRGGYAIRVEAWLDRR